MKQPTRFHDQGTHITVVTYEGGERQKFWITKAKMQPGKDGRLYGHHREYALAMDIRQEPTVFTLLKRREAQKLILPPSAQQEPTQARRRRNSTLTPEQRAENRRQTKESSRRAKREHVGNLLLLCDVPLERWHEVEETIGPPPCDQHEKAAWLDLLSQHIDLGEKIEPLSKVMGCG